MSSLRKASAVELGAGNPVTGVAVAAGAAVLGTNATSPGLGGAALVAAGVVAALPALVQSIAFSRYQTRVEECLRAMNGDLEAIGDQVRDLSDAQFKLVSEIVDAVYRTTCSAKLDILRQAVRSTVLMGKSLQDTEAALLGRTVRDITAAEALFLLSHFRYDFVVLGGASDTTGSEEESVLRVDRGTAEGAAACGLMALGLLVQAGPSNKEAGRLRFAPLVAKVLVLVGSPA